MGRKPAPQPLALSDTTVPGASEGQCTGETLQVTSPVESRSPRSPRSPFRFTTQKKVQTVGGKQQQQQPPQPLHVADLVRQQPDEEAQYPPLSTALAQAYENSPHQQQQQQPQPPPPPPVSTHNHRNRQNDDKASKSGFFFFSKPSKSTERLASHQHTDSRSETMSKGADHNTPVTKQSPKQSGT